MNKTDHNKLAATKVCLNYIVVVRILTLCNSKLVIPKLEIAMLKDLTVPFNRGKMTRSYTIEAIV